MAAVTGTPGISFFTNLFMITKQFRILQRTIHIKSFSKSKFSETMSYFRRLTCMKVISLASFLLFLQVAWAQQDFTGVDQFLERNKKALGNQYAAVVFKGGKAIYSKQVGDEVTVKAQVPIGAASQWLTTALVLSLVDQGKLSLDDPVSKYIPLFDKYMKSYITIRHCLTNTSGIDKDNNLRKIVDSKKYESLEAEVNAIAAKEISNNPGQEFFYGPSGFTIAARICEIVSKKAFERLIQERITRPLKMRATNFTNDAGYAPNPAGGAVSSANDYVNFLTMILNKGKFEDKQILSEESVAAMEKIQFPDVTMKFSPSSLSGLEYGMGCWIAERDDKGNPIVLTCPGLFGVFPYLDKTRNYVAILVVKGFLNDTKKDLGFQFKGEVDEAVGNK